MTSLPRGRPRLIIDRDAVADAVAQLFAEGGYGAVSMSRIAEKLSISRATLYRTVPNKEDLFGLLFELRTAELTQRAKAVLAEVDDPLTQLTELVRLQADAAVQMRRYMPLFFGGGDLPPDVTASWQTWSRGYEEVWVEVVGATMKADYLEDSDPVVATRLILGMLIWVARWYRPSERIETSQIAEVALCLLHLQPRAPGARLPSAAREKG